MKLEPGSFKTAKSDLQSSEFDPELDGRSRKWWKLQFRKKSSSKAKEPEVKHHSVLLNYHADVKLILKLDWVDLQECHTYSKFYDPYCHGAHCMICLLSSHLLL